MTLEEKQKIMSEVCDKAFQNWSFVGFYDVRTGGQFKSDIIYIGEYVSETVFPCPEIKIGKG